MRCHDVCNSLFKSLFPQYMCVVCYAKSLQLCPTLCDPMDYNPSGSSLHGTLQARVLEWVTISSSRGSSHPRDQTHVSWISCIGRQTLYHLSHLGSPHPKYTTVKNLYSPNMSPGLYKIKCISPLYIPHPISVTCLMSTNLIDCKVKVKVKSLSRVRLSVTPWTVAYQAPLGFSRW